MEGCSVTYPDIPTPHRQRCRRLGEAIDPYLQHAGDPTVPIASLRNITHTSASR